METTAAEKKLPVRNLERIGESMKFKGFKKASDRREALRATPGIVKLKIFARSDGTFDLVAYKMIEKAADKKSK